MHLGGNKLLTVKHVLHDAPFLVVDGRPTAYEVRSSGGDVNSMVDDWSIIQLNDVTLTSPSILSYPRNNQPSEGEDVWIIGFPSPSDESPTFNEAMEIEKTIIRAQVRSLPSSWPTSPDLLYFVGPREEVYTGASGGAVMGYDPCSGRLEFLGIYRGTAIRGFLLWQTTRHVARQPPAGL